MTPTFTLACVVDSNPRLQVELVLWSICATRCLPPQRYRLLVYHVGALPGDLADWVGTQGIETRALSAPLVTGSPHCNKIAPFLDAHETDYSIVCDTDLYFVDDPQPFFLSDRLRAPPNNHCNPPPHVFKNILRESGLNRHYRPGVALFRGKRGMRETHLNNISAGIIAVPRRLRAAFAELWLKWAKWLVTHASLLEVWAVHVDQVACTLALEELGEDVEILPPQANAILHLLPEIETVYALHLSTGHIPQFPSRFFPNGQLSAEGLSEGAAKACATLNRCIADASRTIDMLPSLQRHRHTFLNPQWRR